MKRFVSPRNRGGAVRQFRVGAGLKEAGDSRILEGGEGDQVSGLSDLHLRSQSENRHVWARGRTRSRQVPGQGGASRLHRGHQTADRHRRRPADPTGRHAGATQL